MKRIKQLLNSKKALTIMTGGILLGITLSVGFTFAMDYMESSAMCGNCHIMDDAMATHEASSHSQVTCTDCHMKEGSVFSKLYFKATTGTKHLYYNTIASDKIPSLLLASEQSKETIQGNCIRCHEQLVGQAGHLAKDSCTDCHRAVPHGTRKNRIEGLDKQPKSGSLLQNKDGVN